MRINPLLSSNVIENYKIRNGTQAAKSQAYAIYDKVELSENARSFSSMISSVKKDMETASALQSDRIAKIAEQIKNGTYNVSADKVAEKILGRLQSDS